jgi:hypothetical protein
VTELPPTKYTVGPVVAYRSNTGFGWVVRIGRFQWCSRKQTTRMRWHVDQGSDELCNRTVYVSAWPLGLFTVWWEARFRSSACEGCRAARRRDGLCEQCGSRPCGCEAS